MSPIQPKSPESVGSVPKDQPQKFDPNERYGLTPEHIDEFRKDPEIIEAVRKFTGRDFPMEQIDDVLMIQIAGMVQKLGVDGAVAEAHRIYPPELKAQIRGVAMKGGVPRRAS